MSDDMAKERENMVINTEDQKAKPEAPDYAIKILGSATHSDGRSVTERELVDGFKAAAFEVPEFHHLDKDLGFCRFTSMMPVNVQIHGQDTATVNVNFPIPDATSFKGAFDRMEAAAQRYKTRIIAHAKGFVERKLAMQANQQMAMQAQMKQMLKP